MHIIIMHVHVPCVRMMGTHKYMYMYIIGRDVIMSSSATSLPQTPASLGHMLLMEGMFYERAALAQHTTHEQTYFVSLAQWVMPL